PSRRSGRSSSAASGLTDDQRRAAALFDETRTAVERYGAALAELDALLARGAITQDVYSRAAEQTKAALDQALRLENAEAIKDEWAALQTFFDQNPVTAEVQVDSAGAEGMANGRKLTEELGVEELGEELRRSNEAVDIFATNFEDSIAQSVEAGKLDFSGFADSVIGDFTRMLTNRAVNSFLGLFLNAGLGAATGGTAIGPTGQAGLNFGGPRASGGPVQRGRAYLVGEQGAETFVPGMSGMIVPNGARPSAQASLSSGGGGNLAVNLIDKRGSEAPKIEQRQRKGAGGKTEVDLIVADSHSRNLAAGRHSAQMSEGFGVRARPVR
ncbi:MAG: phage tail tape measure C-terminal domain-containing protein, partial [Geminicoccaceae bacterium]